jgi:phosphoribosyl-AMP cyclohydrolase
MKTTVKNMKQTLFQCHKRQFIKGEHAGEWQEITPIIEYGDNATSEMLIDGSGYFITDVENQVQYFVNMEQLSEIGK